MAGWTAGYAGHTASSSAAMYHSPLKVYEYAALGLDVLGTRSDDLDALAAAGVPVHVLDGDLASVVRAVRQHAEARPRSDEEVAAVRARLAARHTWDARAAALLAALPTPRAALDGARAGRGS